MAGQKLRYHGFHQPEAHRLHLCQRPAEEDEGNRDGEDGDKAPASVANQPYTIGYSILVPLVSLCYSDSKA